jgi:hypothetical protein
LVPGLAIIGLFGLAILSVLISLTALIRDSAYFAAAGFMAIAALCFAFVLHVCFRK